MDSFLPVSFMSIFYGFLKLINFPPFVRNSWHRHKPRRRETLPTGYMSKLSVFNPKSLGARSDFTCMPCSRESPVNVSKQQSIISSTATTSPTAPVPLASVLQSQTASCLGCLFTQSHVQGGYESAAWPCSTRPLRLQCTCQMQEPGLGIWFFSASQVLSFPGEFAAKDNEPNGISPGWRRKSTPGELGPTSCFCHQLSLRALSQPQSLHL